MTSGPSIVGAPANARPQPVAPPTTSNGVRLAFFEALGASDGTPGTYVAACVATRIPGWVEEARPIVTGKAVAFTARLASDAAGEATTLQGSGEGPFEVAATAPAGGNAGTPLGIARTFVGFDGTRLVTCGAVCVRQPRREQGAPRFCDASVLGARLIGTSPPPPPGIALGALALAVQRPSDALALGALLAGAAAMLVVATRRRPRTRPPRPRSPGH